MTANPRKRRVGGVLYDGFELLDLYGPLEMFGCLGPEIKIVTVADRAGPVRSAQGPRTVAEYGFAECPELDVIVLPGGIGSVPMLDSPALLGFLRQRAAAAEVVMSVCTGSALLAKAGLLDGRRATSNKMFFSLATSQSDQVEWTPEARWVEDWPFVTSSGVSAGMDAALAVIAHLYGRERATMIAGVTEYQWHTDADRDPFFKFLNRKDIRRLLASSRRQSNRTD